MRVSIVRLRGALLVLSALIAGGNTCSAMAQAQQFSNEELARRAIERRAVEAVIWGMPAVNFELMYQAMVQASSRPLDTTCSRLRIRRSGWRSAVGCV